MQLIQIHFQGNRIGNKIAKLAIEFIKRHIDPDPTAASVPLYSQIKSLQSSNDGSGFQMSGEEQGKREAGATSFSNAQSQRNQEDVFVGGSHNVTSLGNGYRDN